MDKKRLLPGAYGAMMGFIGVLGLFWIVPSLMSGNLVLSGCCLIMISGLVSVLGFVELTPGRLAYVRIFGRQEFALEDIADLGMDYVRVKRVKYWFPVLQLATGEKVELRILRSRSKRIIKKKCTTISEVLRFVDPTAAPVAAVPAAPAEVFTPLPGLEQHWS